MLLNTVVINSYQRQIQELHVSDESLVAKDIRLQQLTVVRKSPILHIVRLTMRHHLFLEF